MQTSVSSPYVLVFPDSQRSLNALGLEEAERFKWIVSEKAGRDLGEAAIREWICKHWNGFLRERWVEHLQGKTFWVELKDVDYGILQREFRDMPLLNPILERLKTLEENLDIIGWALDEGLPMEDVRTILRSLDVNSCRIRCDFDPLWKRNAG